MQALSTSIALQGKSKGEISHCHVHLFIHLTIPPNLIYIAYHLCNTESLKNFLSSNIFAMFL